MKKHYKMSTEAEKTTKTKETHATKMKTKVTTSARHCHQRSNPHPANRIGELIRINIINKKIRNRKTTNNASQTAWGDNWEMMDEMDKRNGMKEPPQPSEEKKTPSEQ